MVPNLLAAGDWMTGLIPIVVAIIWFISQLVSAARAANQKARMPQRRPGEIVERPLAQPPKQAAPTPGKQTTLNAEIEQFLKRAAGQRERPRREPAPPPKVTPPKVTQRPPAKTAGRKPSGDTPSERRGFDNVAASVEKHLSGRGFTERAEHLADDIVRADEQMEQHVQKAFGRRVGTLTDSGSSVQSLTPLTDTEPTPDLRSTPAAAVLTAMLANPESLKNAIILNEILARPEHRW